MTVSINSITIPSPMRLRGSYVYDRFPTTVDNGMGETQTAGLPKAVWTFTMLSPSEYTWWTTTLLAGAASKQCAAVLWDDNDVETTFTSVIVRYPKAPEGRKNGYYRNVQIIIDAMVKA